MFGSFIALEFVDAFWWVMFSIKTFLTSLKLHVQSLLSSLITNFICHKWALHLFKQETSTTDDLLTFWGCPVSLGEGIFRDLEIQFNYKSESCNAIMKQFLCIFQLPVLWCIPPTSPLYDYYCTVLGSFKAKYFAYFQLIYFHLYLTWTSWVCTSTRLSSSSYF